MGLLSWIKKTDIALGRMMDNRGKTKATVKVKAYKRNGTKVKAHSRTVIVSKEPERPRMPKAWGKPEHPLPTDADYAARYKRQMDEVVQKARRNVAPRPAKKDELDIMHAQWLLAANLDDDAEQTDEQLTAEWKAQQLLWRKGIR